MKKRLVALFVVLVMAFATVSASAANYDGIDYKTNKLNKACDWLGINSWDNLNIYVQDGTGDGYGKAVETEALDTVYGCVIFASETNGNALHIVLNSSNTGWDNNGDGFAPVALEDGTSYYGFLREAPIFENTNDYSQFVLCNWTGAEVVLSGIAILGADGSYLATVGECPDSPFLAAAAPAEEAPAATEEAPATLPQTGVVSGLAIAAIGAALAGCGAVVVKKNED